ncbi:unnamed protein product [Sphagnum tenellum]
MRYSGGTLSRSQRMRPLEMRHHRKRRGPERHRSRDLHRSGRPGRGIGCRGRKCLRYTCCSDPSPMLLLLPTKKRAAAAPTFRRKDVQEPARTSTE